MEANKKLPNFGNGPNFSSLPPLGVDWTAKVLTLEDFLDPPQPLGMFRHFGNKSLAFDKRHLDCYDWRLFVDIRKLRSLYALALFNFKLSIM